MVPILYHSRNVMGVKVRGQVYCPIQYWSLASDMSSGSQMRIELARKFFKCMKRHNGITAPLHQLDNFPIQHHPFKIKKHLLKNYEKTPLYWKKKKKIPNPREQEKPQTCKATNPNISSSTSSLSGH